MSPKVSAEYMQARRDEIIDAALRCFSKLGLERTTLRDISGESGLSLGTLYHHFPKKSDIVNALRERSAAEEEVSYFEQMPDATGRAFVHHAIDFAFGRPDSESSAHANRVAAMLWAHALLDEETREGQIQSLDRPRRETAAGIAALQRAGLVNKDLDPDYVVHVILGILIGVQIQKNWEPGISAHKAGQVFKTILDGEFWVKDGGSQAPAPVRRPTRKVAPRGKR